MEKKKAIWGFIFTIPAIVFFMIFDFYPVINAFWMSFFKKDLLSLKPPKFIGFKNYTYLFTSEAFWNSVKATAIFTLGTFIPMVLVSLVLAALIMTRKRFQKFLQMAYYSPAVLSSVVAAMIWLLMFDPRGLANQFLNFLFSTQGIDYHWLSNENMLRLATIIVYFWKYVGYFTVIFVSGMASIPRSIHEAAIVDGASGWQDFLHITLPLLKPTTLLVSVMSMIQCLKTFSTQYLFVQGGAPRGPIDVITLNIYNTAIRDHQIGRASAMSVILFFVIMFFTYLQFKVSRSEEVTY
ncbi:MAG TPA: sugar ABC transporter permease [Fervidobacterium sp.]|nr:sugar ABC transporter permease [Fervidobacterium sp.]HPT54814.1 sugar ABC transporter permease [Fervidobacterium sp.]HPZ18533.1 sugar ABC transporter permease [Fervidobacterium sp.]HQE49617.1 sugar ABC transporter permease [Fervidobacterium sp.]HRD20625.1 sugar ABC transporter permease [Fervidobacterium sp.]